MKRRLKIAHSPIAMSVKPGQAGKLFLFLGSQKIARFIPERRAIEFKDHHKGGRVIEVTIPDFAQQLVRLVE